MKRVLTLWIVLIMLCSFATLATNTSAAVIPPIGDVNEDGLRNSDDLRRMMLHIVSDSTLTSDQCLIGDFDGDNVIDTTDARALINRIFAPDPDYIPLSGFEDVTDSNRLCVYTMQAEYTDTYTFSCTNASSITVKSDRTTASGSTVVSKTIVAGEWVEVTVKGKSAGQKLSVTVSAKNHNRRLPYEPHFTVDPSTLSTASSSGDPLQASPLRYEKRAGGSYIYLNNPEKLHPADIGQAIQRDEGLTGDVQVTWEHSNYTGQSIYLGYQLKNEGDDDVYVTVYNIGMQVSGEWLGQQSWSDYYNQTFDLPDDYFDAYGNESSRYEGQDFIRYTPRVFQPTTYKIPAGKYIYVLGGSTYDAYNNTSVANTANRLISAGRCTNAVVKFHVTGGDVTGTFYCYTDCSQVWKEPAEQGFVTMRDGTKFGSQYKGIDAHQGLVEANLMWTINDNTSSQWLPVTYQRTYDTTANQLHDPFVAYTNNRTQTKRTTQWNTNINPQSTSSAVGSDMINFNCITTDGTPVTIGPNHADWDGEPANLGNWMVDYQDNMTFVNQGDRTRTVTINKNAYGALMAMVLDSKGNLLKAKCTIRPISESPSAVNYELYTLTLPPHSVTQITVNYVLMGNSYGNVSHWVVLN